MKFNSYFQSSFETLLQHRIRSSLIVLGIAVGIASTVTMMALGRGVQQEIDRQFSRTGSTEVVIRGRQPPGDSIRSHEQYELKWGDYVALTENAGIIGLDDIVPIANTKTKIQNKGKTTWVPMIGVTPEYLAAKGQQLAIGDFINAEDNAGMRFVAVLGSDIATALFSQGEYPLGISLRVDGRQTKIIGVLAPTGTNVDKSVLLPFMTVQKRLLSMTTASGQPLVDEIHIRFSSAQQVEAGRQRLAEILRWQRGVGLLDHDDFEIESADAERLALNEITGSLSIALTSIAAISLFVGGVGVTNIMLVSLGERTREIGIHYSVGASSLDISMMFLIESITLCILGGALGLLACAYGIVVLRTAGIRAVLGFDITVLALLISIGVGLIAGLYPALRARNITPAEALRFL